MLYTIDKLIHYMFKTSFILVFATLILSASYPENEVKVYNFKEFKSEILDKKENNTLMVINFWATWCGPCIKELPYFEEVNKKYANKNVRVILVSLDFEKQYNSKLLPFVKEKNLKSEIIWLNDTKYNEWIDQVSPQWSGAIPATVFVKNSKVLKFMEKELELEELESTINNLL